MSFRAPFAVDITQAAHSRLSVEHVLSQAKAEQCTRSGGRPCGSAEGHPGGSDLVDYYRAQLRLATGNAELFSSAWTGTAAAEFRDALERFNSNGNELLNALREAQELLCRANATGDSTKPDSSTEPGSSTDTDEPDGAAR